MFDHNPNLSRWGNTMEFINGVAAGALNPFQSASEAVGLGDALYGAGYAIDKSTMHAIAPLSADGKLSAIGGLGRLGGAEKDIGNAVRDWSAENPNAAETVEAAFNVMVAAKATKLTKSAKAGKAGVSDDFSDASNFFKDTKYTSKVKAQAASGDYHGFPEIVDNFANSGKITQIKGGDGITRQKLEIPGGYRGKEGVFEYIKEPNGSINHRLFKPNK